MNTFLRFKTYLLAGFCFIGCFVSCSDDANEVGLEIKPPGNEILVYNDSSSTVIPYSIIPDSTKLNLTNQNMMLGYCNDPDFGVYESDFFAELKSLSSTVNFDENAVVDSVVIYLGYNSVYGDTLTPLFISVYEMFKDSSIIGLSQKEIDETLIKSYYDENKPLATIKHTPAVHDSAPPIRIPLPIEFGERFFEVEDSLFSDTYFNKHILRGFFFDANQINTGGSILTLNNQDSTRVILYYHEDTTNKEYTMLFHDSKYKCNVFNQNFKPEIQVFNEEEIPDTNLLDTVFYLKGNYGIEARIKLNGFLSSLENEGPITINKAVLEMNPADSATYHLGSFPVANAFYVYVDDDESGYLSEYITSSGSYEPVRYNSTTKKYQDNILSNHISTLISEGKDETTLILRPANNITQPNRTVFKGFNNPTNELKLYITYTKLN